MRWIALVCACAAAGCVSARIRSEAAVVLRCSDWDVSAQQRLPETWEAEGCGRFAVCELPKVERAEVVCVEASRPNAQSVSR